MPGLGPREGHRERQPGYTFPYASLRLRSLALKRAVRLSKSIADAAIRRRRAGPAGNCRWGRAHCVGALPQDPGRPYRPGQEPAVASKGGDAPALWWMRGYRSGSGGSSGRLAPPVSRHSVGRTGFTSAATATAACYIRSRSWLRSQEPEELKGRRR